MSRTSQAVAIVRAGLDRPVSVDGDPDAQRKLCAGMPATAAQWVRPQMVARTRFFDAEVLSAIARGVHQVVVCGAGYDDRALRFRTEGVRFFEVDHPVTQVDKARRLEAMGAGTEGLTLVPADFRTDRTAAALADAGHRADEPSAFLCEGLLVYLDQPTIVELLTSLVARATVGSVLVASLAIHPDGGRSDRITHLANARRRAGQTEPWRTILPVAEHLALLDRAGWEVGRGVDAADLSPEAPPDRTLLVTAGRRPAPPP